MYKEMWIELANRLKAEVSRLHNSDRVMYGLYFCLEHMNEINNKRLTKSLEEAGVFLNDNP